MVVTGKPPLGVGIKLVVGGPAFVLVSQSLLCGHIRFSVKAYDPLGALIKAGMDKHLQTVGRIL